MTCNPSWADVGGDWVDEEFDPLHPYLPYRTWEYGACGIGFAIESFVLRDESPLAGFTYVGVVEEFSSFIDTTSIWVNTWDTCQIPLEEENPGDVWIEDEPFNGTPGVCDE